MAANDLSGLRVVSFESRRAKEMAELIRRRGGEAISAPSMREVPLSESPAVAMLVGEMEAGRIDVLILLTGVGTRAMAEAARACCSRERFIDLLREVSLVARGPKPAAALREMGLSADVRVPEPNTWRELLTTLDAELPVGGKRIAVQEYGVSNDDLLAGLRERGAEVLRVPVYRWALPEDTGPLREALRRVAAGEADVVLFTSANQVESVLTVAAEEDVGDAFRASVGRMTVASIGPIASAQLGKHDIEVDIEPEHPKMGHLVAAVATRARSILERKRT